MVKIICYLLYHLIAKHLPLSYSKISFGSKKIRSFLVRRFIQDAGRNINVEKGAWFSPNISIGDNSGIGVNCFLNSGTRIGKNVMMGPEVHVYTSNHRHERIDVPMIEQGYENARTVIIEDDVWIGAKAIILPGVRIGKGSIIGAGSIVTKDVAAYSVAAGNPAKVIKQREKELGNDGKTDALC
jgi:maltose O-acetyltransferase